MRLGAHWNGRETEFLVFSKNAEKVELCLFANEALTAKSREIHKLELKSDSKGYWSLSTPLAVPGTPYA